MEIGDVQRAGEYTQKDLDLITLMVGTDDRAYLRGESRLSRMGHWFRHLENMGGVDSVEEISSSEEDDDDDDEEDDDDQ